MANLSIRSFQKYTPNKTILGTLPIEDLGLAVETAKRILTKEKRDRQLAGHSSLTPFTSIEDGYHGKKVTFDMQDSLDDKIDKLTSMISNLTAQDNNQNKQFNPRYIKVDRENNHDTIMIRLITKTDIDQRAEIEGLHSEVEVSMDRIIGEDHVMSIIIEMNLGETI